jgi:hypothetical protein
MNLKEFIEKIRRVESEIDIENVMFKNVNLWPIYRLKIAQKFKKKKISTTFLLNRLNRYFNYFIEFISSSFLYFRNPLKKMDVDVIYFTRSSESQDIVSKKIFNRYSDTYQNVYSKNKKVQVIESFDFKSNLKGEKSDKKIVYLHFLLTIEKFKFYLSLPFKRCNLEFLELETSVNKHFKFDVDVKNDMYWIMQLSKFYEKVIKTYSCKKVFFVCFYRPDAMAICLACKRLNISSVEYQHGIQNDNHPMYSNWTKIPKKGFDLLPANFWMWEEVFAKRIIKWTKGNSYHQVFVGGNLWLNYQKLILVNSKKSCILKKNTNKIKILVSLQGDDFLPKFFLDFIKKYPNDYDWFFRDHPRLPISEKNKDFLTRFTDMDISLSSNCPLYELFKFTNIHITGFSTVGYEASAFNIGTIFIHKNAKEGLSDLLESNNFHFANDEYSLLSMINKNITRIKNSQNLAIK